MTVSYIHDANLTRQKRNFSVKYPYGKNLKTQSDYLVYFVFSKRTHTHKHNDQTVPSYNFTVE